MYIDSVFFFFNDTATTEIYTLSLHDALPIYWRIHLSAAPEAVWRAWTTDSGRELFWAETSLSREGGFDLRFVDRKSTRLNSSHANISYAVFCLKKKKKKLIW